MQAGATLLFWTTLPDGGGAAGEAGCPRPSLALDGRERARVARAHDPTEAAARAAAYGWRRTVLAALAGTTPEALTITHRCPDCGGDEHGRPVVPALGSAVSWSRCAKVAVLAVSPQDAVGVDVELDRPGVAWAQLHETTGHPGDDPALSPLRRWTAKEAALKQLGTGLTRDPATVAVGADRWRIDAAVRGALRWTTLGDAACVAVSTPAPAPLRARAAG